jgi:hypothetical protein
MQKFDGSESIVIGRVPTRAILVPDAVLQNLSPQDMRLAVSLCDRQEDADDAISAIGWPCPSLCAMRAGNDVLLEARLD